MEKKAAKTLLRDSPTLDLKRDLSQCQRRLQNKTLKPQSHKYYSIRVVAIKAELARRVHENR